MDFDLKRRKVSAHSKHFKLVRSWQQQLLFVMARHPEDLPDFKIPTSKIFTPEDSI